MITRRSLLGVILATGIAPAMGKFKTSSARLVIPVVTGVVLPRIDLSDIIAETLKRRAPEIAANVRKNNALLKSMQFGARYSQSATGIQFIGDMYEQDC